MEWLAIKTLLGSVWSFLKRIPLQVWLGLALVLGVWCYGHNQYNAGQSSRNAEVAQYKAAAAAWEAELKHTLAQLADADKAAKQAVADKAAAEKAAAKALKAERAKWARIYGSKPENKAWAEAPIPADILDELDPTPDCFVSRKVGSDIAALTPGHTVNGECVP